MPLSRDDQELIRAVAEGEAGANERAIALHRHSLRHVKDYMGSDIQLFMSEIDNPCPDLLLRSRYRQRVLDALRAAEPRKVPETPPESSVRQAVAPVAVADLSLNLVSDLQAWVNALRAPEMADVTIEQTTEYNEYAPLADYVEAAAVAISTLTAEVERLKSDASAERRAELEKDVAALEDANAKIEEAPLAASETQPSWGWRIARIMGALGLNYGSPDDLDALIVNDVIRQLGLADVARAQSGSFPPFQARVGLWMDSCFGPDISADRMERNHRFAEEAMELVQACGMSRQEAIQLVDYVYDRPVGEPSQEVGGVMVTLAALCLANAMDMTGAAETELARVWTKIEQIRAKQAAKPKHSPLPQ